MTTSITPNTLTFNDLESIVKSYECSLSPYKHLITNYLENLFKNSYIGYDYGNNFIELFLTKDIDFTKNPHECNLIMIYQFTKYPNYTSDVDTDERLFYLLDSHVDTLIHLFVDPLIFNKHYTTITDNMLLEIISFFIEKCKTILEENNIPIDSPFFPTVDDTPKIILDQTIISNRPMRYTLHRDTKHIVKL